MSTSDQKAEVLSDPVVFQGQEISPREVLSFLESVGAAHAQCPACSRTEWTVLLTPGDGLILAHPTFPIGMEDSVRIPFAIAACTTCGFLRAHALATISGWLESQGTHVT
jgi:hypothetical protein